MSETQSTTHHEPGKSKGFMKGNTKWYAIGALAAIAVLVFAFVKKSNSNANSTTSTGTTATLDPTTLAELQSALQGQASAAYGAFQPSSYGPGGTGSGGTVTSSTPTASVPNTPAPGSVSISIPNGALGWETAVFPNQNALNQWNAWNAAQTAPGTRSGINNELYSLGAYNATGGPFNPPTSGTGNPLDNQ